MLKPNVVPRHLRKAGKSMLAALEILEVGGSFVVNERKFMYNSDRISKNFL